MVVVAPSTDQTVSGNHQLILDGGSFSVLDDSLIPVNGLNSSNYNEIIPPVNSGMPSGIRLAPFSGSFGWSGTGAAPVGIQANGVFVQPSVSGGITGGEMKSFISWNPDFEDGSTLSGLVGFECDHAAIGSSQVTGFNTCFSGATGGWAIDVTGAAGSAAFSIHRVCHSTDMIQNGGTPTDCWWSGNGSPNGTVTAAVGSFYAQLDGGAGTSWWVKESGSGNTGWLKRSDFTGSTLLAAGLNLSSLAISLPICTDGSKNLTTSGCLPFNVASPPPIGTTTPNSGVFSDLEVSGISGSVQCLHVNALGQISGTGVDCGSGGGGGVSSLTGTSNQITVVNGSTTPTVSIPSTFTFPGTVTNALNIFGSTTSAQLATLLSDETGAASGSPLSVFNQSPTIVTPTIASFTNATHNHTNAAGGGTLTLAGAAFPNQGTTTTLLHGNASGNPSWSAVSLTADVSGITPSANGGTNSAFFTVAGPATSAKTFTFPNASATVLTNNAAVTLPQGGLGITAGTSGGVPYFASTSTVASSAALTVNSPVIGGGAGAAPTVGTRSGNTTSFATTTGALTSAHLAKFDASGNIVDGGLPSGSPGGSPTQIQYNASAFAGDSTFTFDSTSKQINASYVATTKGPAIDPRAYGCKGDGTDTATAATLCWTSAEAQMQSTGGYIYCQGNYTLNRITLNTFDTIRGPSGEANSKGCRLTANADAIFVSSPTVFQGGITITGVYLVGGQNGIDLPLVNELVLEHVEGQDQTGCLIVLPAGERWILTDITGQWSNVNGFATLCSGDETKSVFNGSIAPGSPFGSAQPIINGLKNLTDHGGGHNSSWLWWEGTGVDEGRISGLYCFFCGQVGLINIGNGTGQNALIDTFIDGIDIDHAGDTVTPEAIGIHVAGVMKGSRITHYAPCWNTNYMTTQLLIDNAAGADSITNSLFCTTVDNVNTFAIKLGPGSGTNLLIESTFGGLYVPPASVNSVNEINLIGSFLSPNNVAGSQVTDTTDTGWNAVIVKPSNSGAATSSYSFKRGAGSSTFTTDFSSDGTVFTNNLNFLMAKSSGTAKYENGITSTWYSDAGSTAKIIANGLTGALNIKSLNLTNLWESSTAPTISSGFGSSPSVTANNGTAAFRINVGTGASATSGVIGMPTAAAGWNCAVNDLTAAAAHVAYNTRQTTSTVSSVTVENQTTSTGAAIAWAASDILTLQCAAF